MINKSKKNEDKPYKDFYLIYDRKSTDDAESQKNSLDYQKYENLKFAEKEGLPIAKLTIPNFCENGIISERHSGYKEDSGFNINTDGSVSYQIERPKFLKLITLLNNKEIKGVIFLCWDRSSRNKQDDVILKKLIKQGSDIRFSQTQYDKSSSGDLHMDIDGMFASHYSRVISEKVRNANVKLRMDGRCLYHTPIGYLDKGSDNKPLDPERAPIVKRIFELYSTGEWGVMQLSKWAKEQGLTTKPTRNKRSKEDIMSGVDVNSIPKTANPVNHKSIENILKNPFYIGKIKNPNGGLLDSKFHSPLIDTSLFNKVQEILKSKCISVHYIDMDFFTYRGMLRCSCGRSYSPYTQKGINYYRVRCIEGCTNPDKNLTESDVHNEVQKIMDKMYFTDEELIEIEEKTKKGIDTIAIKRNNELDDLHNQKKRVFADLDYLTKNKITLLRTESMGLNDIKRDTDRLTRELADIESKIAIYSESVTEILDYIVSFSELVKNASLYYRFALDSEKHELVKNMFTELVFEDRELVKYEAKDGFDALLARERVNGWETRNRT